MSKYEAGDLDLPGYFLPEDSQFRLAKLRDYMEFLSRLAQPRTLDEERDGATEVGAGELAICLELLAEQADLVLAGMSWVSSRQAVASAAEGAAEHDGESEAMTEVPDATGERFVFGLTVDQVDALHRLLQTISAHGDVLALGDTAELADGTVPTLGQAIHDAAATVRAILDQATTQRLRHGHRPRTGVGEERAVYAAGLVRSEVDDRPGSVLPLPAYRTLRHPTQSRTQRLN
jgi:hypothetical protein